MKVPVSWLKRFVDIDVPLEEFKEKMIMGGNGIEGIETMYDGISNVVIGRIDKLEKHPDADRLKVAQVSIGKETVQIVTGADNVYEGALVPAALHGATLANGLNIKRGKLRGVESDGMLCSGAEIGITDEDVPGASVDGILILEEGLCPGDDFLDALELSDTVIEFEVGANRPDCLSIKGIARETASFLDRDFKDHSITKYETKGDINEHLSVEIADNELCPRYMAAAAVDIKIAPSPQWMRRALRAAGIRPISNIVDITNYVMLETGQPMHAFDAKCIHGGKIIVRRAKDGEEIVSLDGKKRILNGNMLAITDTQGAIAIAGVMGGEDSEIKEDTKMVIFESANFKSSSVRQTSRSLGLQSESSARFSKGLDIVVQKVALERALELVVQLGAGKVLGGVVDVASKQYETQIIETSIRAINAHLGTELTGEYMRDALKKLFIDTDLSGDTLVCKIPYWRGDMEGMADVAEEVARYYGYNNIPSTLIGASSIGRKNDLQKLRDKLCSLCVAMGLQESSTYSFISPNDFSIFGEKEDSPRIRLLNPLGEDYSLMRKSMLPSMMNVLANNVNMKNESVMLFEMGKVYLPEDGKELPVEKEVLCIGLDGSFDFFELKGIVEEILAYICGKELVYIAETPQYMHPGRSAAVYTGKSLVAIIGQMHPNVSEAYGIDGEAYCAELYIKDIYENMKGHIQFEALPKYPAVERDMAVVVDSGTTAAELESCIKKAGGKLLKSTVLFDVYEGKQIEQGKKSMAFSLVFRADDRTLKDEDVNTVIGKITRALENEYAAQLRK